MFRSLRAGVLVAALALVGCATGGTGGTGVVSTWQSVCAKLPLAQIWLVGFQPIFMESGMGAEYQQALDETTALSNTCSVTDPNDPAQLAAAVSAQITRIYLLVNRARDVSDQRSRPRR